MRIEPMRNLLLLLATLIAGGCTVGALERRTINQVQSLADLRYQEVLDNLAVVAANPGVLPSTSVSAGGSVTVTDSLTVDPLTTWTHAVDGFASQSGSLSGKRNPQQQWTLDIVAPEPLLEGMHYAFLWQLIGPPPLGSPAMELLSAPQPGDTDYHLGVAEPPLQNPARLVLPGWA